MKYIFEVNVYTDGDFGFQFVPRGMEFDEDCEYRLKKSYDDKDRAIQDITNICAFLKEQMNTDRDWVKEMFNECIDEFVNKIYKHDANTDTYIAEYMSGNYDGTEFIFRAEAQYINCGFHVTDEEYSMMKASDKLVTNGMVKEAVLALFRQ